MSNRAGAAVGRRCAQVRNGSLTSGGEKSHPHQPTCTLLRFLKVPDYSAQLSSARHPSSASFLIDSLLAESAGKTNSNYINLLNSVFSSMLLLTADKDLSAATMARNMRRRGEEREGR